MKVLPGIFVTVGEADNFQIALNFILTPIKRLSRLSHYTVYTTLDHSVSLHLFSLSCTGSKSYWAKTEHAHFFKCLLSLVLCCFLDCEGSILYLKKKKNHID